MKLKVSNVCQLFNKAIYPATQTNKGVTFTNNGDGTITVNGTATDSGNALSLQVVTLHKDHLYFLYADQSGSFADIVFTVDNLGSVSNVEGNFWKSPVEGERQAYFWVTSGITIDSRVYKPQLFDLTEMYGAGNEPTTVAQFRQDFPNEMYEYSPVCWKKFRSLKYVTDEYGVVDLGTLSWNKYVNGNNWLFYATVPNGKTNVGSGNTVNAFIDKYEYSNIALSGSQAVVKDSPFVCWDATQSQILIKDTNYTDANIFKSSIVGVKLYYELKTPGKGYLPLRRGKYIANKEPVQLLDKSKYNLPYTESGLTFTAGNDGSIIINGTCSSTVWFFVQQNVITVVGHKYLFGGVPNLGTNSVALYMTDTTSNSSYVWLEKGEIIITTIRNPSDVIIRILTGYVCNNLTFKPQLFDLTAMYGEGNEPTTVAQFRADYPNELYDYNPYNAITFR